MKRQPIEEEKYLQMKWPTGINIQNIQTAHVAQYQKTNQPTNKQLKQKSLMKVKEESENADLKLNIKKTRIMAYGPITS